MCQTLLAVSDEALCFHANQVTSCIFLILTLSSLLLTCQRPSTTCRTIVGNHPASTFHNSILL